jgi:hypothetical protein
MGVIECANCGAKVNDAAPLCPECGADPATMPACPACGALITFRSRACTSCGATLCPECRQPVDPDSRFCRECGASLGGEGSRPGAARRRAAEEAVQTNKLQVQVRSGAIWLFAIAGFTLFNAVEWLSRESLRMVVGLASTRQLTFLIVDAGTAGKGVLLAAAIVAAAVFTIMGVLVLRGMSWALLVGIVLYAADLVVFVVRVGGRDMVGLFFHLFALAMMITAYRAMLRLESSTMVSPSGPAVAKEPPPAE